MACIYIPVPEQKVSIQILTTLLCDKSDICCQDKIYRSRHNDHVFVEIAMLNTNPEILFKFTSVLVICHCIQKCWSFTTSDDQLTENGIETLGLFEDYQDRFSKWDSNENLDLVTNTGSLYKNKVKKESFILNIIGLSYIYFANSLSQERFWNCKCSRDD